ncbi:MAG TPA: glycoside hydrolase family 16 protein [Bacteroidales bacterium]|nr:glycoside hydrolase family 16 protein [Bacteroidales bacterium]HPF02039.1 glycoside hydrolase family 16 protein [Bacteroidales bacterium]HPJ59772.1 glycoside hydrolase family 16 protein [Bacteroidales bacterium]HPR12545.1 glycoside hydrolase family 16 protein [Bacteroidales bacterium]HRW85228.1 glycoside hydrolase family 16 protein [Bacteroidales bacterium]
MRSIKPIFIRSILFLGTFALITACGEESALEDRTYTLVWQDEFNTDGAPDNSLWVYDIGGGGWGNAELQTYTSDAQNIVVENGALKITAINNGGSYTSARIKTQGKFDQAFGRFEARIRLPWGPGIWPAFWMLGADIETNPWPECGEIDIMEYRGQQPNLIHGSVHGPGYSGGSAITKSYGYIDDRFDVDYHIFAVEWAENFIRYYVDDILYQEINPDDLPGEWVYDHPFFLILNVAVGGSYVGFPTPDTPFPQTMYVDYVRVYEEAE